MQAFTDRLVAGDVGCVPDNVTGSVVLRHGGTTSSPITLQPTPGVSVTWASSNPVIDTEAGGTYWRFSGFTIRGTSGLAQTIANHQDGIRIDHNDITNNHVGRSCIIDGYLQVANDVSHNVEIDHNVIHDCGNSSSAAHDHGIYSCCGYNEHIHDNVIYDVTGFAVQLYPDADGTVVDHNVIDGNSDGQQFLSGLLIGGDPYVGCNATDNVSIHDNIVTYNAQYGVSRWWGCSPHGTGNVVSHNCWWGNPSGDHDTPDGYTFTADNIRADPLYVDRSSHNYALRAGSPCIGMAPR
jgi:hypothetical protein